MKYETVRDAARAWVNSFNAIPEKVIEKLMMHNPDEVQEITPPRKYDRVCIFAGDHCNEYGEIVCRDESDEDMYVIALDDTHENVSVSKFDFDVERDDFLPMWGTMWTFGEMIDEEWVNGEILGSHLQEMADCGFRIYEQEDFGLLFGIDGAGYDFYEEHWIPLYKARGLKWHEEKGGEV